jgi:hypothetical protein
MVHPRIKFAIEEELGNKIKYLDISIAKVHDRLQLGIYIYIEYNYIQQKQKKSSIRTILYNKNSPQQKQKPPKQNNKQKR